METRLKLRVDPADWESGVPGSPYDCGIGLTLGRLVPDGDHPWVDKNTIRITVREDGLRKRYVWTNPQPGREAIISFDAGVIPPTIEFVLENPQITECPEGTSKRARMVSFKARGAPKSHIGRVFGQAKRRPV